MFYYQLIPSNWQIFLSFLLEFITDICCIHTWRSLWLYQDLHLFVECKKKTALASLIIGLFIYFNVAFLNKKLNDYFSSKCSCVSNKNNSLTNRSNLVNNNNNNNNTHSIDDYPRSSSTQTAHIFHHSFLKNILLNLLFLSCFVGTVCIWRGIWEFQLYFCYPNLIESAFWNQNLLNLFYFVSSLSILWYFDLLACLASRSLCEDSYFKIKDHFILLPNHFETFFSSRIVIIYIFYLN